ncbi:DinB family protein [Seonamhaeicola sp. NFXS20]|uniref:DinB family protein n=1 Tax=Seonamhaeicola sp. NFXS20 TaxID=2816959 RepID=UPI003B8C4E17
MKIEQPKLLVELQNKTAKAKSLLEEFKTYSIEDLNYKANASEWSILECIEHLCLYGKFYLPEIENRIITNSYSKQQYFKSGLIGNYFVNIIKASNTKKIKATKEMDTTGFKLNKSTINQFLKQLEWLDSLLVKAEKVNLMKVKTSISLTKLIKLRLGDTLRFLVYHNERHLLQAKRIDIKPKSNKT